MLGATTQSPVHLLMLQMDEITEEQEDEEGLRFSAWDLCQVRNAIVHLLKSLLRLLSKFSLKEKPQCIQNCIEVSESNSRKFGAASEGAGDS